MDFLMGLFLVLCGLFMVLVGVCIGIEAITTTYGIELIIWGFTSLITIVGGLMFFAMVGHI